MNPDRWRQVEKLYHEALERAPEQRWEYLNQTCEGDKELRQNVESLLARRVSEIETPDRPTMTDAAGLVETQTVMQLSSGTQLGPYRIEAAIGAGGMGQVFRATDTRLGRTVAIKTSHEKFSQRFEREARAISALNHPNICTLHDVGPNYLVMELVEGETLATRLKRGKLPIADVLKFGQQIADALAAAHAKGIVHRDLKPGNVMLTKTSVKVLDFGLAKSAQDETLTVAQAVMGTPAYMAPEQREGRECDARTDIYALGLVLHEMAAGKRRQPDEPPQLSSFPQLAHIVEQCLAPDADERWQTAADIRRELGWTAQTRLYPPEAAPQLRPWPWIGIGGAAFFAAGVFAYLWISQRTPAVPANPLAGAQFTRFTDFDGAESDAAISRDGRYVAFRSDRDGTVDTWMSQVGTGRFINMTHGTQPSVQVDNIGFTPDGSEFWLPGRTGGTRLRLMPVSGGATRAFLSEHTMNVSWSPDGSRLVSQAYDAGDPLTVSDASGANGKQIYIASAGGHNHFPIWSTDGQWIYFVSGTWDTREMDIWRIRPAGGTPERLTNVNSDIKYLAPIDSHTVLYSSPAQDGSGPWLWALDTETKQTLRASYGLVRYTSVEASGDGRRLVATESHPSANLWTIPLSERKSHDSDVKPLNLPSGRAFAPRYSGQALYYLSSRGGGDGVWRYQDGESTEVWRGVDGALQEPPAPSPDGRRLGIILRRQGQQTLHTVSSEGGDLRKVTEAVDVTSAASWSPDGNWIAVSGTDSQGPGLFKVPAVGGAPIRLNKGSFSNPVWSPDGTVIAYLNPIAARMGRVQFLRTADGTAIEAPALQVRIGDEHYRFIPGRQQLVYMLDTDSTKQTFWIYDLSTKATRQLSDFDLPGTRTFDITADGKQIVFDRLHENSEIVLIDLAARKR